LLERFPDLQQAPKHSLALVQSEVERLSRFVETILDFSALEAGRFPIELAPVPFQEVLQLALQRFPETSQSRVKLSLPERLEMVQAVDAALESIFFHLFDNAFKYAPEGEINFQALELDQEVEFRIWDTGPGIPDDQHQRIFEMFHRLDVRDSREVYGYGLGLPMVLRLLTAMAGRIEARDKNGGTEMVFWLPKVIRVGEPQLK
ncbi:MAG: ATP-binding protein, partial [Anaerolineales bacterium]|nr:ATP-binding protein [Anaerolineales bacterium]